MPIFLVKEKKLEEIKNLNFENEKAIQDIIEKNLRKVFNLKFVRSEFSLNSLRIDTLTFREETKSFVIIEYKKDKNVSVIDQGFSYLSLLLNNKADFILEYNENTGKNLRREDVDWSQSRVIFISPNFTKYQKLSIGFKDLPIELWEIKKYQNNTILLENLEPLNAMESIKSVSSSNEIVKRVNKEIKVYTEEEHLNRKREDIKDLYYKVKEGILDFGDDINIKPKKLYIGFVRDTNFVDIRIDNSKIKLWINLKKGELHDPKNMARDITKVGHWGNGDYEVSIRPDKELKYNLSYILVLIKQSYDKQDSDF